MPKKNSHKDRTLTLGPVLGVESQDKRPTYTCIVVMQSENPPQWKIDGQEVLFRPCAKTSGGTCWRAEWQPPLEREVGRPVTYSIIGDRKPWMGAGGEDTWAFYLPGSAETPKFVYASCNGFSAAKLMASCEAPHAMWSRLEKDHEESPLSLLVMGGDQIYADSIWEQEWMREFAAKSAGEMAASPVPPEIDSNLDAFYERLYFRQWNYVAVARMLARIPSIMMWDDHDIFDGWGSHPDNLQSCPVYQRIFKSADRAFRLFQLRDKPGRIGAEPDPKHYGYVCQFCNETFLMLDHRTERTTTQVMGEGQWQEFKAWLATFEGERLFIQSAVPVVYRNFGFIERVVGATPRREEIEDDLLDHWSAREHQQERLRFVYSLVNRQKEIRDKRETNKEPFDARWVVLSGDVHVGCMGSIWEKELNLGVYQVVSSGIVHPPPTPFQWLGIRAVSGDGNDRIGNGDLETEIHPIAGASSEFLRTRNYARLQIGTDHKVWVNWRCESKEETVFAI